MQKPIDLVVEDTKDSVYKVLNNSGLPISAISMIVREINTNVETQYSNQLNRLRSEYQLELANELQQSQNDIAKETI